MLSGEGNAGEWWKTTTGLSSKKRTFASAPHFFCTLLCSCFARLQRETSRNFVVYTFYGGNVVAVLVHFLFHCGSFSPCIGGRSSISHFVTAATKFSSNKKCLLCLLSLALDLQLCRPFSPWTSLACRLLSLFLCLSPALYSKFVARTINLS